jgi:tetratricopeptide (TPR) repeat protein
MRLHYSLLLPLSVALCIFASVATLAQPNSATYRPAADSDFETTELKYQRELSAGVHAFNLEKYDQAENHFKAAITLKPNEYLSYYNLGIIYIRAKKYRAATPVLKLAEELRPTHQMIKGYLGLAYEATQQYEMAVKYYRRALGLNKANAELLNNLGNALFHTEQYADAASAFAEALNLRPAFAAALVGLCVTQTALKNSEKRLEACLKAVKTDERSASLQYLTGHAFYHLARYDEALDRFQIARSLEPKSVNALNGVGFANLQLRRYDEAMEMFGAALQLDPKSSEAKAGVGTTYFQMRKYRLAADAFREALSSNPGSVPLHYNLAVTCLRLNERDCALQQYNSLKKLESTTSTTLFKQIFAGKILDARRAQR